MILHSFLTTPKTSEPPGAGKGSFCGVFFLSSFYSLFRVTLPLPHYKELEIGKSPSGSPALPSLLALTLLLSSHVLRVSPLPT